MAEVTAGKIQKNVKVAVIWINEINGCKYIMAGKNFPLEIKFGRQDKNIFYKTINFIMNFPAGKQDKNESLKFSAARELSEETGGFFCFDEISVPWLDQEFLDAGLIPTKINIDEIIQINNKPISIFMFNPWQNKDMEFEFFFFKLETKNISVDLLTKFCQFSIQKLPDKQFKHYKEVFGYESINAKTFFDGVAFLEKVTTDKYWFLSNNSKKSKIDISFLFKTTSGTFFFNKRYFFALSQIMPLLKASINFDEFL